MTRFKSQSGWLAHHWSLLAIVAITASSAFWPIEGTIATRLSIGWIVGVLVFLAVSFHKALRSGNPDRLRQRAADQDVVGRAILPLALFAATASIASVVGELIGPGHPSASQSVVAVATVAVSWVFIHTIFAFHYARRYYARDQAGEDAGGLMFPGTAEPDDWDFLHFSLIIGVAAQTADVQITSRHIRRLCTVHSLVAFIFNTVILALAINLIAGFA